MALWIFTESILGGRPIPVFNHGNMKRDFTYVDDIVDGVARLAEAVELPRYTVYNIGNHRSELLTDYVAAIEGAVGRKAQVELLPLQPGDVEATWANVDAIGAAVGYRPTTPISVGVPRFVEWYLAHPELTEQVRQWRAKSAG